uniref:Uncharacterized protein n=1 Tax=Amazona collaria TaxID=241587 RepID=A0A8B9EV88_9PSIT
MSQATLFPLTPQLQIDFHSPGSRLCQTMSSQPATERCLMGTADEKLMAVTSKQRINTAGNAERRESTGKKQHSRHVQHQERLVHLRLQKPGIPQSLCWESLFVWT